jgi:hypothetical protein
VGRRSRYSRDGWLLHFYDSGRDLESVDDLVPGVGDVFSWARRNGARDGTPFFVGPSGRADARVNAFWRAPGVRGLAEGTLRRYAFSLRVWLDFLDACGLRWDQAGPEALGAFKEWRLSAEEAEEHVAPGSFRVDLAAIRRFYGWASSIHGVDNPVRVRVVGETFFGNGKEVLEASPSGVRRADVKWLTPEAFRRWRNLGLRGFTRAGLPCSDWKGPNEDRDVAFADGLFGTGLRLGEWSSLLTVDLPMMGQRDLYRCWLASACAKRSVGRPFWLPRRVVQAARLYAEEGGRPAAVARAQAEGRYERIRDRWLLERVRPNGVLQVVDANGKSREVRLDALRPKLRMRLFRRTRAGLEPAWLWLNHDGTPRPARAWHKTFARANERVSKALTGDRLAAGPLWCRPHMLRHSFALRWYCIVTFVSWQRTVGLTPAEQRDFRDQLGDVWFLLASLLGHRTPETTREVYLEPFQALQVEQLVALMEANDRAALERLAETLAIVEPRVLAAPPA